MKIVIILFCYSISIYIYGQSNHEAVDNGGNESWNTGADWNSGVGFDGIPTCAMGNPVTITIPNNVLMVMSDQTVTLNCEVNLIIENGGTLRISNSTPANTASLALGSGSTILVEIGGIIWTGTGGGGGTGLNQDNNITVNGTEVWNGSSGDFVGDGVTYANEETLPVELINFEAKQEENAVTIRWSTASELNNDYFTVYRSEDGVSFDEIAQFDGNGTTSSVHNYSATDNNPIEGLSYYKLSQTDFDDDFEELGIVSVTFISSLSAQTYLYPNPTDGILYLNKNISESIIRVYNISGQDVSSQVLISKQRNKIQLDLSSLKVGQYLIKDGLSVQRVFRQ